MINSPARVKTAHFCRFIKKQPPFFLVILVLFILISCLKSAENTEEIVIEPLAIDPLLIRAGEIISEMDDRLLVSQILISGIDGRETLPSNMTALLTEIPAGGIMLFKYNLNTDNEKIKGFIKETADLIIEISAVVPFFAVDHEGGSVNRFMPGTADLRAASEYWDIFMAEGKDAALEKIKADSEKAAKEISELGINMNFAPVAEHLMDENRIFLARRSYGPDPVFAGEAASAFLKGMENSNVLCVVKHFPGSAGLDPHYSASELNIDNDALLEIVTPFITTIQNGARAIMAAHTIVTPLDTKIASLSSAVMIDYLRGVLGFEGIIISDDFIMAAAGNLSPEESAVLSIAAGSDMILVWPAHLKKTHDAFLSSLEDGRLSRERLKDAATRVIYEKLRIGLINFEESP